MISLTQSNISWPLTSQTTINALINLLFSLDPSIMVATTPSVIRCELLAMSILEEDQDKLCLRRTTVPGVRQLQGSLLKKAVARAQHVDAASDGRPDARLSFCRSKKLTAFRLKLIMDFNGAGTGTVPRPQYPKDYLYPVPNILRGVRKVTTYQTEL